MSKRTRSDGEPYDAGKIARAISYKEAMKFPRASYGKAYFQRGVAPSINQFGPTFKEATAAQKLNRKAHGFVGRGMYQSNRGMYQGRGSFSKIGGLIGDTMGRTGLGDLGKAGRNLGKIADIFMTGRGAYSNSLVSMGNSENVPMFTSKNDETGSLTISHREYVTDIYGNPLVGIDPNQVATPFVNQTFSINPGIEKTFPWLSQIAANYEEYDMKQLMFTFRSTTSDIGSSTNGQVGTVILATNYNAAAPSFIDKKTMLEYDAAASCKTTEPMIHGVECDPNKLSGSEGKYIRTNPVLTGEDLKTYDHGTFQIAVAGTPGTKLAPGFANQSIGELWVSYTVTLRKPKFYTTLGLGISRDVFVSGGGETSTLWMGTQALLLSGQQNNIGCAVTLSANNIVLTFPSGYAGNLRITLQTEANDILGAYTNQPAVPLITGNVTYVSDLFGAGVAASDSPASIGRYGFSASSANASLVVDVFVAIATNGVNNTLTIVTAAGSAAPSQTSLEVIEYNTFGRPVNSAAPVLVNPSGTVVAIA